MTSISHEPGVKQCYGYYQEEAQQYTQIRNQDQRITTSVEQHLLEKDFLRQGLIESSDIGFDGNAVMSKFAANGESFDTLWAYIKSHVIEKNEQSDPRIDALRKNLYGSRDW